MPERSRRKELLARYKETKPEAGVYRIVNTRNLKVLVEATINLASIRNKFAFAKSSNMPGALDLRLKNDILQYGIDAFALEVLDTLEVKPEMSALQIQAELATLKALWLEKCDPSIRY